MAIYETLTKPEMLEWSQIIAKNMFLAVGFLCFTVEQRRFVFARACGKCEDCGKSFKDGWLMNVHHVRPLHLGGKDEVKNGRLCCISCHANAHRALYNELGLSADFSAWKSLASSEQRTRQYLSKHGKR